MPATGPIPPEVGKCFNGANRRQLRPRSDLVRAVHGQGRGRHRRHVVRDDQADRRLRRRRRHAHHDRPEPELRTVDGQVPEELPDEFDFTIDSNADDIFQKVQAGDLDDEISQPPPKTIREYVTDPSLKSRSLPERRRPHQLHHDEPDPAAVRRHPRAQGDEPDHRQGGLQKAWGGSVAGSIATHVTPNPMLNNVLGEYDPYKTPGRGRQHRQAEKEMKRLEVRHEGRRQVRRRPPARTSSWSPTSGRGHTDAADHPGRRGEDRHHVQGPLGERRVPGDQHTEEQHPDLRAVELGEGLRRPGHVLHGAVPRAARSCRRGTRTTPSSASRRRSRRRSGRRAPSRCPER